MKPFYKVCLIAGSALLFLGLLVGSAGWAVGRATGMDYYGADYGYRMYMENGTTVIASEEMAWEGSASDNFATNYNSNVLSPEEFEGQIKSLNIDIGIAQVYLMTGDTFNIETVNSIPENFSCEVIDGTLVIKDTTSDKNWQDWISDSIGGMFRNDNGPEYYVYLPYHFVPEKMTLNVGAGDLYAEELSAVDANITTGIGDILIEKLTVSGKSEYHIGTGDLTINDLDAKNIKVDCGVGDAYLFGNITGNCSLTCGVGSLYVNTTADGRDFNYKIECGIGSVEVDDKVYDGIGKSVTIDNGAENDFNIKCGVGDIQLLTSY